MMITETVKMGAKAPYAAPKLAVYGEFSKLTASGSGTLLEGPNRGTIKRKF